MTKTQTPLKIFIGWDSREDIAYQVAKKSIENLASVPVDIQPIKQRELRRDGVYLRDEDKLASTEFTFTRYLVPYLADYKGWALFIDCDFLFLDDVAKLFEQVNDNYAVMCAQHDYTPQPGRKMDGKQQIPYPRKNSSSMMLLNCAHPKNKEFLTPDNINAESTSAAYVHRFSWLDDQDIGKLSHEWNWLVGWYKEPKDGKPKALHYTEGGPWFEEYQECEYAIDWIKIEHTIVNDLLEESKKKISDLKTRVIRIEDLTLSAELKEIYISLTNKMLDPTQKYLKNDFENQMETMMGVKVASILTKKQDDTDFDYRRKGVDYDPYLKDFILGVGGKIGDFDDKESLKDHTIVIRGLGGGGQKALKWCQKNNIDFYAIDTGYIQPKLAKTKQYHRITKNSLQNLGPLKDFPSDRLNRLNWRPRKHRGGSYILICPPSEKVMKFYNQDLDTWMDKTIAQIKKHSDREIRIRLKPSRTERVTTNPIQSEFDDMHCLVTFNSIAATEALLYGKPAITLAPNAASMIYDAKIENIESLPMISTDLVEAFARHLSYNQFTSAEMRSGFAWKTLRSME